MLTINEMQKVYKKVNKFALIMDDERDYLTRNAIDTDRFEDYVVHATNLARAGKQIEKIANSIGKSVHQMMLNTLSEEAFVMWCLIEKVEFVTDEVEETEE